MTDDLRARILDALNDAPASFIRDDPESAELHQKRPWRRHDQHRYDGSCALCRGEADTLADAVMAVLDREFARPLLTLDPPSEMSGQDVAAWHAAWPFTSDTQTHVRILPPNGDAAVLRRVRDAVTTLDGQLAREDTGERHVLQQIQSALTEES